MPVDFYINNDVALKWRGGVWYDHIDDDQGPRRRRQSIQIQEANVWAPPYFVNKETPDHCAICLEEKATSLEEIEVERGRFKDFLKQWTKEYELLLKVEANQEPRLSRK
jgi:hypothetical protein